MPPDRACPDRAYPDAYKVLTPAQVQAYERDGCLAPVRAMSPERARHYRERFERLEGRVPDIKKRR